MADIAFNIKNGLSVNNSLLYAQSGAVGINTRAPSANLHVVGTMLVTGPVTMANTLLVNGAVTFANQMTFSGNGYFTKGLRCDGNTDLYILNVSGATTISNTLYVSRATTLANTVTVANNLTVSGTLTVSGATTLNNTLNSNGVITLSNLVNMSTFANVGVSMKVGSLIDTATYTLESYSNTGTAVYAQSISGSGVYSTTQGATNVPSIVGVANTGTGVRGISTSHYGVYGSSNSNYGVYGTSIHGWGGYFTSTNGPALYAGNNSVEFFRVAAGGFVGINNGAPAQRLHVGGDIMATGDVTAFGSDERLKKDIAPITDALEKVKKIRGITYKWNQIAKEAGFESEEKLVGVLAQDVEKVLPEVVKIAPFDAQREDHSITSISGDNYLTVQYEKLVPLLIEAIKELSAKVDALSGGEEVVMKAAAPKPRVTKGK